MLMKEIKEKLSSVLSESEIKDIEKSFNESVSMLVKEETSKIEVLAEEFCAKKIEEGRLEIMKEAKEVLDESIDKLEEEIVDKLDSYLETRIDSTINESKVLSVAINETLEPIVDGIRSLFENKFVALDVEGAKKVADLEERNAQLEESLTKSITENMSLNESSEAAACKLYMIEHTALLTPSQKERVQKFFAEKSFEELHEQLENFVSLVTEGKKFSRSSMLKEEETIEDAKKGTGFYPEAKKVKVDDEESTEEDTGSDDDEEEEKKDKGVTAEDEDTEKEDEKEEDDEEAEETGLQNIISIASKLLNK